MSNSDIALSRRALARLAVADEAADASDRLRGLVDPSNDEWARPGEIVEQAARLFEQAREILAKVVVYERLKGASWETIGSALGEISKQAAHERYGSAETEFRRQALLAWLIPEEAYCQLGEVADAAGTIRRIQRWQNRATEPGAAPVDDWTPPAYKPMDTTEQSGLVIEAASLLSGVGIYKNAPKLTPEQRSKAELGLARRKVALYTAICEANPEDPNTAEVLAGARARLTELEEQAPRPPEGNA
ncbi:hypothetical protein [Nonomuraea sp. NPDC049758]|uniref:hypothetical protein n=1 Tax=Nonomuraea sp. NPDC049758 TaxID=3154360 RepID=UPI00342EB57D